MELEIEEREGGDEELMSIMRAQIEILKNMLINELDDHEIEESVSEEDQYVL